MAPTILKPVDTLDIKGNDSAVTKQPAEKPAVLSSTHKTNHMVELKEVTLLANKCIAHLAQSRICPKLLGNSKALTQQVKSVVATLDKLEKKIAKAIILKAPKP